jgi:hypothetical protein
MMPSDPWDLAVAEQACCFIADIWGVRPSNLHVRCYVLHLYAVMAKQEAYQPLPDSMEPSGR